MAMTDDSEVPLTPLRKALVVAASCLILGLVFFPLILPLLILVRACTAETTTISNLSGYNLYIVDETCAVIATQETVNVSISKGRRGQRVLLFAYVPDLNYKNGYTVYLPSVRFSGPRTLRISLDEASEVYFQRHDWDGLSIEYEIGFVRHPGSEEADGGRRTRTVTPPSGQD